MLRFHSEYELTLDNNDGGGDDDSIGSGLLSAVTTAAPKLSETKEKSHSKQLLNPW